MVPAHFTIVAAHVLCFILCFMNLYSWFLKSNVYKINDLGFLATEGHCLDAAVQVGTADDTWPTVTAR